MDDESAKVVLIDWHEGMEVPVPSDYEPQFVEVGDGVVIDEARWRYINEAIMDEHPDHERLWKVAAEHPGLNVDKEDTPENKVWVLLAGERIGLVDSRVLDVQLTPNVAAGP